MCIGVVEGSKHSQLGVGAHEVPGKFIEYFNVYAGPFCPYHRRLFQIKLLQLPEHDTAGYEEYRLFLIDEVREMEVADVNKVLVWR